MSMEMLYSIEEFKDFISKDYPVIVLFSTHGCATCEAVENRLNKLLHNMDKAKIYLDDIAALRGVMSIFSVPVLAIYIKSKEFYRFVRVFSMYDVKKKIERLEAFI